ncbi:MAG TPA: class E sortase [Candidatus Andersenbacteria bacterium]|nr:class E sortase [Candidatus Andersenbacteria bacterium]
MQKTRPILLFVSAFFFASLFFTGAVLSFLTFAPLAPSLLNSLFFPQPRGIAQLPLSPDRVVPFSTPAPEIVINPYPIQVPLTPAYNSAETTSNLIRIPSLGITVPVVLSPSLKDTDVIATLNTGAALYPNGVAPGALGNTFISAHSTGEPWKGAYRFAFIRINELKTGDALHVDWKGTRYSYRITTSEIVTPTSDFRVISDRPIPTISLMACWPLWSTKQRMLIHAQLTNITQLTRPVAT